MKQTLIVSAFMLLFPCSVQAQSGTKTDLFSNEVLKSFDRFHGLGFPEKLYIQTDKPYYSSGDKIWLKGYLVNGINHTPILFTYYIYVELYNSKDELITRIKIKGDEHGFANSIPLDVGLAQGYYTLRAYTQWMCNNSSDFFFSKVIRVVNPFLESKKEIVKVKNNFDLQFFPEGGALLPQIEQCIAFKAIGADGLSTGVELEIFDSKGSLILKTISLHKGMGKFLLTPESGGRYYAIVTSEGGVTKRVSLPAVEKSGCNV